MLEFSGPSSNSGYKSIWRRILLYHGLFVSKDADMLALKQLDPYGSINQSKEKLKLRQYQNPGPNFFWYLDSYDKLKPFGFPSMDGCIDEYSRKIIWLKTIHSNNDPFIVGTIFLDNVKDTEGCPST